MRHFIAACALLFSAVLAASPAHAEWRRAVSTHFVVYSEGSPEQIRAAAERLERFDGLLRRLSPTPPQDSPIRLTVYMPGNRGAIESLLGAIGPAGFYKAEAAGPYMVAPRHAVSETFGADVVLFHEYLHHFMLQNYSTAYPPWFVEGYAELFSATRFERDGSITIGAFADHRARELGVTPPPLADLLFLGPRAMPGRERSIFYANAWMLTHYLVISGERQGQLARYIDLVGAGRPSREAAEEAFGGLASLQRDFLRYRSGRRIPTLQVRFDQAPQPGPVTVEALSPGEENLLWQQLEYRQQPRGDRLAALVRRVREGAARTPDDPAALQLLADTEALAGNFDAATRAVDALLARRPEDPRGLLGKGLIELALLERGHVTDAGRWRDARNWIRRANRAAPDDPHILVEYYRAWERQGTTPPRDAFAALSRAFELVPQDFRLRWMLTRALVRERRYAQAADVLSPVAYSPHGGSSAEAATRLIEAIRALPDGAEPPPAASAAAPGERAES